MKLNSLHDVLVDELRDLYSAEKQLVKAIPHMIKGASSTELQGALEDHLAVTEVHVERLEKCFEELDLTARAKTCRAMEGLIEEGGELLKAKKDHAPDALDAAIIAAAQKVEHYEISGYGSCRAHAETLGLSTVAELLQRTLDEESAANELLTKIAETEVNPAAASANAVGAPDEE